MTSDVAEFYARFSYDVGIRDWRLANPRHVQLKLLAESILRRRGGLERILDVGCGSGVLTAALRRYGEVTAIDYSEPALALARELLPDVRFVAGSLQDAAFPAGSFDAITLFDVVEHVPRAERGAFLGELARLSTQRSLLLLSTPHATFTEWLQRNRPELMQVVDEAVRLTELVDALEQHGFTLAHYTTYDIEWSGPQYQFAVFERGIVPGLPSRPAPHVRRRVRVLHSRVVRRLSNRRVLPGDGR